MTLVKICGITNLEDALTAIDCGADALGFNFYKQSPRYIEPEKAKVLLEEVPPSVWRVGVFVNESEAIVEDLCQILSLDYVQFHGDETPYYCDQFATPHWKAFRVQDEKSIELMKKYHCDYFLIDTYIEKTFGGTGVTGDWNFAKEAKKIGKIFLAGGLRPENVAMAVKIVEPAGVDVASGVESSPGKKDPGKIEEFIRQAKGL